MGVTTRREFLQLLYGTAFATAACRGGDRRALDGELIETGRARGHRAVRDGARIELPAGAWQRARAVVVGAGVAGLAAAWWLRRSGFGDVVVLELDDAIGGTARSGRSPVTAYPWAAHYVVAPRREQTAMVALFDDIGAFEGTAPDGEPIVDEMLRCREPEERLFHLGRWYPGLYLTAGATATDHAELARFDAEIGRWAAWRDAAGRRAFTLPVSACSPDPEPAALDRISFATWLDRLGLRSPRLRWMCDYACRDDYGLDAAGTSAWAGVFYFASRLAGPGAEPAPIVTWPDGNGALVDALARGARIVTGAAVIDVSNDGDGVAVTAIGEQPFGIRADRAVIAAPQFVARRIVPALAERGDDAVDYGPWVVANLHLRGRPRERAGDVPLAWDNVLRDSPSLGYVVATHQRGRDVGPTVFTWYYPFCDVDAAAARRRVDGAGHAEWAEAAVADLSRAHRDLRSLVERVDVAFWGHGMARPRVGSMAAAARQQRATPIGRIHFAHTDLSGLALFEEALDHGVRAAREVIAAC